MKAFKLFALALLFPIILFAQSEEKALRKISTEGKGKMTIAPDWITTYISVESKSMDYGKVVNDLNAKASTLEKQLVMAGFSKQDLKTSSYTVNKNIIWAEGRSIDSGYVGQQSFTIEFENNPKKVADLVKAFAESKVSVNFNFAFGLSPDKKINVRNQLIQSAVKDASEKAKVIAEASGVKLKNIIKIDYGQPEINNPQPYMRESMAMEKADQFGGFNLKDIELTDSINIVWEIE